MQKKSFSLLLLFVWMLTSCEKELNIKLQEGEKKIVVEGVIETGQLPYVSLTRSIGFFDKINLNSVDYIHQAIVVVKDLGTSDSIVLKEYVIDTTIGTSTFSFSIYGPDFNDPDAMNFKGQVNHFYQLSIRINDQNYYAVTKIPESVLLDSVWVEPVPGREDSFSVIKAYYDDPDTAGNAVRLETLAKRYTKDGSAEIFQTSFNSVYDDAIINGTRIPITIDLGYDKSKTYTQTEYQTIGYVRHGDTVTLKWSAIDRSVFRFWETLSYSAGSVGNPFASPVSIQSNVPGALGVWGGYGSSYYTVIDSIK
ncbi:MAG: DUF4249 family protein [Chitinophagaceae bacterium]|nr:DUF4249 family protein [Chitinophagaceae bacterium]